MMKILAPKLKKNTAPQPARQKPKKFNPKFILPKKRSCCGK